MRQMLPSMKALDRYNVNRPGWEAVRQSLYDYTAYAAAGQTQLVFFALPVGQGGKTLSDTNMTLAGQLPANQEFLIESIELKFLPTVPAVAANNPAFFGAGAVNAQINDVYIVSRTGNLTLTIGSKTYLQEAPLGRFPAKTAMQIGTAMVDVRAAVPVAAQQSAVAHAVMAGRPYFLSPSPLRLISTQNFTVTLNWPEGVQAITNPGRIGVVLEGILYRRSQ